MLFPTIISLLRSPTATHQVDRAAKLIDSHLEWRVKYDIDNIKPKDMRRFLQLHFIAWQPNLRDKESRGVAYLFPSKFDATLLSDIKQYVQFNWWFGLIVSAHHIDNDREGYVCVAGVELQFLAVRC